VSDFQQTTDQQDLKRIDIVVIWNAPDLDANSQLQIDSTGKPKLKLVDRTVDAKGTTGNGPAIQSSGKTIFVDRLSDYHETD